MDSHGPPRRSRAYARACWITGPKHCVIRFLCHQTARDSCQGTQTTQDMQVDMLSSSPITTLRCLTPAPRSADGTTTTYSSAGIANTTCHVKRCQEVYRRGRESVTCAIYRHSARLHCTFGALYTQNISWMTGRQIYGTES